MVILHVIIAIYYHNCMCEASIKSVTVGLLFVVCAFVQGCQIDFE